MVFNNTNPYHMSPIPKHVLLPHCATDYRGLPLVLCVHTGPTGALQPEPLEPAPFCVDNQGGIVAFFVRTSQLQRMLWEKGEASLLNHPQSGQEYRQLYGGWTVEEADAYARAPGSRSIWVVVEDPALPWVVRFEAKIFPIGLPSEDGNNQVEMLYYPIAPSNPCSGSLGPLDPPHAFPYFPGRCYGVSYYIYVPQRAAAAAVEAMAMQRLRHQLVRRAAVASPGGVASPAVGLPLSPPTSVIHAG